MKKNTTIILTAALTMTVLSGHSQTTAAQVFTIDNSSDMMIRIAEIEIDSNYFDEYIAILKEEAASSIQLEPGVLCIIYPMF